MSNAGRWARWYDKVRKPAPYGDETTYALAATWLGSCSTVQDWGCGKGWFAHRHLPRAVGVDGTRSPYSDIVADLVDFRADPQVDGILLRHVLEHDPDWDQILDNAIASARRRLFIAVFTPEAEGDEAEQIGWTATLRVPDLALPWDVISERLEAAGFEISTWDHATKTQYGAERVWEAHRR